MKGGSSLIILNTMGSIFWISLMGCESGYHKLRIGESDSIGIGDIDKAL